MKRYCSIIADPPWQYQQGGRGAARNHYPTMSTEAIAALPVREMAADDAVLFCWFTWAMLPDMMQVLEGWGFTYKTGLPWVKTCKSDPNKARWGGGQWVRACSEPIAIAVRGNPSPPPPTDRMLALLSPTLGHSRKPDDLYQLAEQHDGPYLELFARRRKEGWDCWGNQSPEAIDIEQYERASCQYCHRPLEFQRRTKRYCSTACRVAAHRSRVTLKARA